MSEIKKLENRIQVLEKKLARYNRGLLNIPKRKFPGFVCGTIDIKKAVEKGSGIFRFELLNNKDIKDIKDIKDERIYRDGFKS